MSAQDGNDMMTTTLPSGGAADVTDMPDHPVPQRSAGAIFVPITDDWWEPTEDPDWYRTVDLCGTTCHHPIHAFHPERRRHLDEADFLIRHQAKP